MNFNEQSFLCHHGIKGMKWGIRRYQNPDGSLTSEGRARYKHDIQKYMGYKSEKYRDKLMKKVPSALKKLNKKNGKKEVTTEELNEAYKAIRNASNSEIAEQLMIKKKKGVEGAIIGASEGVVEATIFALMGKKFTKVLKTSVSELGFDVDALGVEIKQDPKLLAKSYARKTTVSAAEGYLLSQIGKDKAAALSIISASNKRIQHSSFLAHYGIKGMK